MPMDKEMLKQIQEMQTQDVKLGDEIVWIEKELERVQATMEIKIRKTEKDTH